MVRYKIRFKNIYPRVSEEYTYNFNCYIGISMNNPLYYSKGLPVLLKWISSKYPNCIIIVADYLDRLNQRIFKEELSLNDAIKISLEKGKSIDQSIQSNVANLQIKNISIHHWNEYYELQEVQFIKQQLYNQLSKNKDFYTSVSQSATEYLKKKSKLSPLCTDKNINLSIEYIVEELAVISYLINKGAKVQLYPGTQLPILKQIASREIILHNSNLDQGIYVELAVKKSG